MRSYLQLMRVHHYIKNFLVFLPLVCSGLMFKSGGALLDGLLGFIAFCMISSAVYVINDIKDVEKDRSHPTKSNRPVASGKVSIKRAKCLVIFLFVLSMLCNLFTKSVVGALLLLLYFVLNIGYSYGLKNIAIIDVAILVSGFLIRVYYGSVLTKIEISNWLYLTIMAAAFYFSLGKRRNELKRTKSDETRSVLKYYSENFLDKNMYVCVALANTFYALWAMEKSNEHRYLMLTVPMVLLIFLKYSLSIEGDSDGDPVEVVLHDKVLLVLCIVYAVAIGAIIYL